MSKPVKLAVVQMSCTDKLNENVKKGISKIREAAKKGAKIILLQELFENLYFCQLEREEFFKLANPTLRHPFLGKFQELAKELKVVLPVSFFEKAGQAHYNSLMMIDADGKALGVLPQDAHPRRARLRRKIFL